ncbi:MAG: hypothetical protein IT452_18740 [Planctomycetia bacterium]|nr:hypothetical protein [Planctomycetia bacterium]
MNDRYWMGRGMLVVATGSIVALMASCQNQPEHLANSAPHVRPAKPPAQHVVGGVFNTNDFVMAGGVGESLLTASQREKYRRLALGDNDMKAARALWRHYGDVRDLAKQELWLKYMASLGDTKAIRTLESRRYEISTAELRVLAED